MKETPLHPSMNLCVEDVRGWEGAAKCAFRLGWVSVDSKKYEMMLGVLFPCFPACWYMLSFISSESSLAVIPWDLTAFQGCNPPCTLTALGISPACLGLALSNVKCGWKPSAVLVGTLLTPQLYPEPRYNSSQRPSVSRACQTLPAPPSSTPKVETWGNWRSPLVFLFHSSGPEEVKPLPLG